MAESNLIESVIPLNIHALPLKAMPIGSDEVAIADSADSFKLKRASLSSLGLDTGGNVFAGSELIENYIVYGVGDQNVATDSDIIRSDDMLTVNKNVEISKSLDLGGTQTYVNNSTQSIAATATNINGHITSVFETSEYDITPQATTPFDSFINDDGRKIFIADGVGSFVIQYTLGTPFLISSSVFTAASTVFPSVATIYGISFSNNGNLLFILDRTNQDIKTFVLATSFDVSTASATPSATLDISLQGTNSISLSLNPNGTKLYLCNEISRELHQYTLSVPFDLTSAAITGTTDFSLEITTLNSADFSPNGLILYLVDGSNQSIFEYQLLEPWNIANPIKTIDNVPIHIDTGDVIYGLQISSNQEYLYYCVNGSSTDFIKQSSVGIKSSGQGIFEEFLDVGSTLDIGAVQTYADKSTQSGAATPENVLGHMSTLVFKNLFTQVTNPPLDVFITDDGLRLTYSTFDSKIKQEVLTIPFDVTSGSDLGSEITSLLNAPTGVAFSSDGLLLYVLNRNLTNIQSFTLTSPFDISTAVAGPAASITETAASGLYIHPKGTSFYFGDVITQKLHEYTMSIPFDLMTLTKGPDSALLGLTTVLGVTFSPNGKKAYVSDQSTTTINEFMLPTPWDITNLIPDHVQTIPNIATNVLQGLDVSSCNDFLYVCISDEGIKQNGLGLLSQGSVIAAGDTMDSNIELLNYNSGGTPYTTDIFTDNETPLGNVTVPIAHEGSLCVTNEGAESGLYQYVGTGGANTDWLKFSANDPALVIEINRQAQFDALETGATGTIVIDTDKTIVLKTAITTGLRFIIDPGISFSLLGDNFVNVILTYTGSDTFITGNQPSIVYVIDINNIINSSNAGTFLQMDDIGIAISLSLMALIGWGDIGTVTSCNIINVNQVNYIASFGNLKILDTADASLVRCLYSNAIPLSIPLIDIKSSDITTRVSILDSDFILQSGEAAIRVDPNIDEGSDIQINGCSITGASTLLFDESGATNNISSQLNRSYASLSIDSVVDNGGAARFNYTISGSNGINEFQIVTISGTTSYNGTFVVTGDDDATYFDIAALAFVADEAGTIDTDAVLFTTISTTPLINNDSVFIDIDLNTDYDGGYNVYDVQASTFKVNAVFVGGTVNGTWSTNGLNQKDIRIIAKSNSNNIDSKNSLLLFSNSTSSQIAVGDLNINSLLVSSTAQRFKLIGLNTTVFEYIANEPFEGIITASLTLENGTNNHVYEFIYQKDTGGGFVDLADGIILSIITASSGSFSGTKPFSISANKGDRFKLINSVFPSSFDISSMSISVVD